MREVSSGSEDDVRGSPDTTPAAPAFERVRVRWLPLWLVGALVLFSPFQVRLGTGDGDRRWEFVSYVVVCLALALWAWRQCRRARIRLRALLGPWPSDSDWRLAVLALPLLPLALGAIWLIWLPISYALPDFVQEWVLKEDPAMWIQDAPLRSVFAILTIVVVAPVVEEIVFRGVLLHRFAVKWGPLIAVLLSSVLFGILHADVLGKSIFGIVMVMLYVRTGGLWLPIACHMLNNAAAVAISFIPWIADEPAYSIADFRRDWYIGALGLLLAVVMFYALRDRLVAPREWRLPVPRDVGQVLSWRVSSPLN